jgi:hypothetical protein
MDIHVFTDRGQENRTWKNAVGERLPHQPIHLGHGLHGRFGKTFLISVFRAFDVSCSQF